MGDIAEAFEQHLRSLSDNDWNALVAKVRPAPTPDNAAADQGAQPGDSGRAAAAKRFGTRKETQQ
ncbi:hypothetical protein LAUMK136_05361 [Mycobacterium attenuatum]|uniref:Uncharacterized protein n=1 Tax=Mycobacterium attenuatum TaxID=2341086 RepID=A0A498QHJ2_9MYCO|nr:hypothetical protein LAUMK136_05361 [Mycobacterium attenuatum]